MWDHLLKSNTHFSKLKQTHKTKVLRVLLQEHELMDHRTLLVDLELQENFMNACGNFPDHTAMELKVLYLIIFNES